MARKVINTISVSFLDVLCCTLGAVLLLYIVVPKINPDEKIQQEQLELEIEKLQYELELERIKTDRLEQEIEEANRQIENYINEMKEINFAVITMSWTTNKQDVDLWVVDPGGRKFYFQQRNFPGVPGNLSTDTVNGPGIEVWEAISLLTGTYRIYANLFDRKGNRSDPKVQTRIFYRGGIRVMPEVILSSEYRGNDTSKMKFVGEFKVTDDGRTIF